MTENEKVKEWFKTELSMITEESLDAIECEDIMDICVKALEEVQQYRAIGTVEECRVAVERMKPKKPIYEFEYKDGRKFHDCPVCGTYVTHALEQNHVNYCNCCGQRLDWSE
ncbi:MAG: hypothetical protein J6Q61_00175 [Bacteroidales bacterium]|nr:hypothetical protein [Bacteroidales bacterium]